MLPPAAIRHPLPLHPAFAITAPARAWPDRPQASGEGTFGPGFYLTSESRAGDYARYDAKIAADPAAWGNKQPPPQHDGVVYACDVSGLRIKPMSWDGYYALMEKLLGLAPGEGIPTPANKVLMTQLLAGQGYDGIQILDDQPAGDGDLPCIPRQDQPRAGYHYRCGQVIYQP